MNDDLITPNNIVDASALAIWIAAFFNFLPSVAALLSVVWIILRILETRTVQHMFGKRAWVKRKENDDA